MVNIHERKRCGIPVIIEGETGVGKTSLVHMLSVMWNTVFNRKQRIVGCDMWDDMHDHLNAELFGGESRFSTSDNIYRTVMFILTK